MSDTIAFEFQGFATTWKIFALFSISCNYAQKIGNFTKPAENKGKSALLKSSPPTYPQKPWTALLLPLPPDGGSPDREST
jgi:hypothetical protein